MGRNFAISLALHAVMAIIAYVGLPTFHVDTDITDVPISVEIVNVTDVTNMPTKPKKPAPVKKAAPVPPPKPPAPPPAPQGSVEKPPAPEPIPEAPPEQVAILVQPDAKPKAKEKPKPKDKPKKADTKKRSPAPLPPRKPKAPDAFASVLKTLEELKQAPPPPKKEPEVDFAKMMENALETDKVRTDVGPEMTISEIDLVRQQIHRCWNLPGGAKDAHTMQVSIRISMNPDGMVRTASILDMSRMSSDPFYRAMAESALRAVTNTRCQPFKLPPEKYERWKNMKLNFDPKDMFGL